MPQQHKPLNVGCDPAAGSIAFVAKHPSTPTWVQRKFKLSAPYSPQSAGQAKKACKAIIKELSAISYKDAPKFLWLEAPIVAGRASIHSALVQAYISGVIQAEFITAGYEIHMVTNTTWKKEVLGKGTATKPEIKQHVKRAWPKLYFATHGDQDLMDAAAIAHYGETISGRTSQILRRPKRNRTKMA